MEISVKVPDELAERAKARGLRIEEYVQELLALELKALALSLPFPSTEAEVRSWLSSMTRFSDKIPPLPETISRDWIYQEHD
jgi:hypothetical protein